MKYKVISNESLSELVEYINHYLENGAQLVGGISMTTVESYSGSSGEYTRNVQILYAQALLVIEQVIYENVAQPLQTQQTKL